MPANATECCMPHFVFIYFLLLLVLAVLIIVFFETLLLDVLFIFIGFGLACAG